MKKEKFLALLASKLSGEITPSAQEQLTKAMESKEEYRLLAIELSAYFQKQQHTEPQNKQLEEIWQQIAQAEAQGFNAKFDDSAAPKTRLIDPILLKVAAVLVLFIGAGLWGNYLLKRNADQDFITLTADQEQAFKLLDDGTKIWLNKRSALRYNPAFGQQQREIFLEGEAYFEVAKNKAVPLYIHAGNIDIEVKGTAFNVNAYKERPNIQVALVRGSIEVSDRLGEYQKIQMKPNEKLIVVTSNNKSNASAFTVMPMASATLLKETKWISDTLSFNKEKLKDLVLRMEKKYDLSIIIKSEQLKEKRFSGTFINETIQQALAALKLSYPLTYTINNKLVVIKD